VVPRVASIYHKSYYSARLLTTGAYLIKHVHNIYLVLFMSSRLGMGDRLNSLIVTCAVIQGSLICKIKLPVSYLSFVSFNAPYNPVRLVYEKRTASTKFLILRLMV